jgi:hypothetical protein
MVAMVPSTGPRANHATSSISGVVMTMVVWAGLSKNKPWSSLSASSSSPVKLREWYQIMS